MEESSSSSRDEKSLKGPESIFQSLFGEVYPGTQLEGKEVAYTSGKLTTELPAQPVTLLNTKAQYFFGNLISANHALICYAKKGNIRVINKTTAKKALLEEHTQEVIEVTFSCSPSSFLASLDGNGEVIVWNIDSDTLKYSFKRIASPSGKPFRRVRFHPTKSSVLAAVDADHRLFLYDVTKLFNDQEDAFVEFTGEKHEQVVGKLSFSTDGTLLISACGAGKVVIWNVETGKPIRSFFPHDNAPVFSANFCGTRKTGETVEHFFLTGGPRNIHLKLWSTASEECLQTFSFRGDDEKDFLNHISVSPEAQFVLVANIKANTLFVIHVSLEGEAPGMNYICEFQLEFPILSFFVGTETLTAHEGDGLHKITAYCVQTRKIQIYSFWSYQCLPMKKGEEIRDRQPSAAMEKPAITVTRGGEESKKVEFSEAVLRELDRETGTDIKPNLRGAASEDRSEVSSMDVCATEGDARSELLSEVNEEENKAQEDTGEEESEEETEGGEGSGKATEVEENVSNVSQSSQRVPAGSASATVDNQMLLSLQEHMDNAINSLRNELLEDRRMRMENEVKQQRSLITAVSETLNNRVPEHMEAVMVQEIEARILPAIMQNVSRAVEEATTSYLTKNMERVLEKVAKSTMERSFGVEGSASNVVRQSLIESFQSSFRENLIPAFEKSVKKMFDQINSALENGVKQILERPVNKLMEDMSSQIKVIGDLYNNLSSLSTDIRGTLAQIREKGAHSSMEVTKEKDVKSSVKELVAKGDYNTAFSLVLSAKDLRLVTWMCKEVDLESVFEENITVSAGVILSLIQQLSFDLSEETSVKTKWLTLLFSYLDNEDPAVSAHIPVVLNQVRSSLDRQKDILQKSDYLFFKRTIDRELRSGDSRS